MRAVTVATAVARIGRIPSIAQCDAVRDRRGTRVV
jgi:hypothetical protein